MVRRVCLICFLATPITYIRIIVLVLDYIVTYVHVRFGFELVPGTHTLGRVVTHPWQVIHSTGLRWYRTTRVPFCFFLLVLSFVFGFPLIQCIWVAGVGMLCLCLSRPVRWHRIVYLTPFAALRCSISCRSFVITRACTRYFIYLVCTSMKNHGGHGGVLDVGG